MEIAIKGKYYDYKILVSPDNDKFFFAIKARHNKTGRTSTITTVNLLLSEFNISGDNGRFWESDWMLTKNEMKKYLNKIILLLIDDKSLDYFEDFLNYDRNEGEWENTKF